LAKGRHARQASADAVDCRCLSQAMAFRRYLRGARRADAGRRG
jgi:hypothetical protein